MKILVTGNRGFIGQHMVAALSDHEVITHEWGEMEPDIRGFDWVIHMGANSSTVERNVELIMQQNLDSSLAWLEECTKHNVNLQFSSSASIYGNSFKEDDPVAPQTPYAWSKYLFERRVLKSPPKNICVQMFRYFNVYGAHEDHKGSQASPYNQFRHQANNTNRIKVFEGSSEAIRDFVPVELVVDIHKKFFNAHETGVFNIGTGKAKSFLVIAEEIAAETGADVQTIPMPMHIKQNYQWFTCADMSKTNNILRNIVE